MQKVKATEERLRECEDRNPQLKNQNEELQKKVNRIEPEKKRYLKTDYTVKLSKQQ